ncbi:hypothetical protein [Labrenzia sp. VG12]|uniref:hypothetical protein n=1 Tax=Labrenzia sp. VG12 TaxID=2021862 RepID=UPI000B8BF0EC|nr:hypothetical protein [Labrenzia sp. VG12]ASP33325.1 hypothetical protein CHH27_08760 [Labrenzia sp. VG12]
MTKHTEVYVYEISDENIPAFLDIKEKLIAEAHSLPGLLASATYRSAATPNLFMDRMHWRDAAAAEEGNRLFQSLPTTPAFLALMAAPPKLAGPMDLIAGE